METDGFAALSFAAYSFGGFHPAFDDTPSPVYWSATMSPSVIPVAPASLMACLSAVAIAPGLIHKCDFVAGNDGALATPCAFGGSGAVVCDEFDEQTLSELGLYGFGLGGDLADHFVSDSAEVDAGSATASG
jgi:hypothetical protein